jgi:hypothetical protein
VELFKLSLLNQLMIFNNLLGVPGHRIFLIKHDIKTIIETTRSASYLDMNLKFERDVLNFRKGFQFLFY